MVWHILGVIGAIYLALGVIFIGLVFAGEARYQRRARRRQPGGVVIDFTRRRLGE